MHRGERTRRGARTLLLLAALWAGTGATVAAAPAHAADTFQQCQAVKGSLVMYPGLTDVAADQSVTVFARLTGCSGSGRSGLLGATTGAAQATCASLTSVLLPTTATIAWANGRSSTISLSFRSAPGSPNRLVLEGKVASGARAGDRLDGGLHVSAKFSRTLRNLAKNHKRVNASRQQELGPLNGESGDCTVAKPIGTIKIASYQSLKFSTTDPPPTTTQPPPPAIVPSTQATTTTVSIPKAKVAPARTLRPRIRKPLPRRPVVRRVGVAGAADSSGSSIDPESVLGVICIGAAVALLVVLLMPSRRTRRRRAAARAVR